MPNARHRGLPVKFPTVFTRQDELVRKFARFLRQIKRANQPREILSRVRVANKEDIWLCQVILLSHLLQRGIVHDSGIAVVCSAIDHIDLAFVDVEQIYHFFFRKFGDGDIARRFFEEITVLQPPNHHAGELINVRHPQQRKIRHNRQHAAGLW